MGDKPAGTYLTSACAGNVGAGPFRFVCRNGSNNLSSFYLNGHAPSMDMAPNPYYYGPKPTISIHAPVYTSSDAVFKAYGAGDLDGAVVPSADLSAAKGMKGYMNVTQFQTDHVTVNVQIPPFDNIHCRLAVAYAIDRQGIARTTLNGTETPIYDVLPPGILGYFGREPDVPYYDPGRAKMEIARCPGGLKNLTLTVQNSSPDIIHEYDAVRANLQAIGASVTIKPVSVTSWLNIVTQNLSATKTRITEDLWIDDFPDPQDWLGTLLRSDSSDNISGFKSAQFDSLIQRADVEQNPARRAALYRDAQKIALRGGDWIAVGAQNGVYVIPPRVHGFVAANGGTWPVNNDWSKVSMSSG
jgi:oligopeptide transport system substrate-binding protein